MTDSDEPRAWADESLDRRPDDERYELPVPRTDKGRRTRTAIMQAAETVFGASGYDQASITAITQQADVAQGTFYKYFPSKHSVFVELVNDFAVRIRQAISAAAPDRGAPRSEVERRGLEAFFAFALEHPGLYATVREAQFVAPATYRWFYESYVAAYAQNILPLLGPEAEQIEAETLGWVMAGIADMVGLRWVVWEQRIPPPEVFDQIVELLRNGVDGIH